MIKFLVLLGFCFVQKTVADPQCNFTSSLIGEWYSNARDQLTINQTHIGLIDLKYPSVSYEMECFHIDGDKYVLRSFFSGSIYFYTCFEIKAMTSVSFTMDHLTKPSTQLANSPKGILDSNNPTDKVASCDNTHATTGPGEHEFIVKQGSEAGAKINCPAAFNAQFSYDIDDGAGSSCQNGTFLELCYGTIGDFKFNNQLCNASQSIMYSESGDLQCVYNDTVGGKNYLTVLNTDPSANENSTMFACMVYTVTGGGSITMSQKAGVCENNQVATTRPTDGALITLTKISDCPITTSLTTGYTIIVEITSPSKASYGHAVYYLLIVFCELIGLFSML